METLEFPWKFHEFLELSMEPAWNYTGTPSNLHGTQKKLHGTSMELYGKLREFHGSGSFIVLACAFINFPGQSIKNWDALT